MSMAFQSHLNALFGLQLCNCKLSKRRFMMHAIPTKRGLSRVLGIVCHLGNKHRLTFK